MFICGDCINNNNFHQDARGHIVTSIVRELSECQACGKDTKLYWVTPKASKAGIKERIDGTLIRERRPMIELPEQYYLSFDNNNTPCLFTRAHRILFKGNEHDRYHNFMSKSAGQHLRDWFASYTEYITQSIKRHKSEIANFEVEDFPSDSPACEDSGLDVERRHDYATKYTFY